MIPKSTKQKRKRGITSTIVRISPFRLEVKPLKRGGFTMEFTGRVNGRHVEIEIECPAWWKDHILFKLNDRGREKKR